LLAAGIQSDTANAGVPDLLMASILSFLIPCKENAATAFVGDSIESSACRADFPIRPPWFILPLVIPHNKTPAHRFHESISSAGPRHITAAVFAVCKQNHRARAFRGPPLYSAVFYRQIHSINNWDWPSR